MRVLNPINDTVFKFLMEDIEVAQGLISLIIEEDVVELVPAPQEQTSVEFELKYYNLPLQRMDYVAVIKTLGEDGTAQYHKVSIEVQKSPFVPELGRFRKYVSEKYARKSGYKTDEGMQSGFLPKKTIYFIDKAFNTDLPVVLRRKGVYWDVLNERKFEGPRDEYVELLNHDSWFIQIEKLPKELKSELLHALSVFAPWMRDEENERFIDIPESEESATKYHLLTKIVNRLQLAGKSREVETALEMEMSLEKYIEEAQKRSEMYARQAAEATEKLLEANQKSEEANKQAEEASKQAEEASKQAEEAGKQAEEASKQAEEANKQAEEAGKQAREEREQREEALYKLARKMKRYGEPVEEIAKETGLSEDEIRTL